MEVSVLHRTLLDLGFNEREVIHTEHSDLDYSVTLKQRITKRSLIFKKFNWPYVPKWKRIKELYFRIFSEERVNDK